MFPNPPSHSPSNDDAGTDGDTFDDADSAIGDIDSVPSLTEALSPAVLDYRFENGRRYHAYKDGSYALPNDEPELDRLDLQHHLWRLSLDGDLHLAPLPPSTNSVLDLGTGTGIWAIDFADEHPRATVTGVDLSPVQPVWIPPNCQFQVDDVEEEWTYPLPEPFPASDAHPNSTGFDFIHARMLTLGLKSWPRLFRQSLAHLQPGGYFEVQELDLTTYPSPTSPEPCIAFRRWSDCVVAAARKAGIDAHASRLFPAQLEEAGFVDVQHACYRWPVGNWPQDGHEKMLGAWAQVNLLHGLEAAAMALLCRYEGWSRAQVEDLVEEARRELSDPVRFHQWVEMSVHWGRKPGFVG